MNRNSLFLSAALAAFFTFCQPLNAQTTLVAAGSTWKYLDNGTDQGTAWRAAAFNDSGWASGAAQLGYGDGDEATGVSYGPSSSAKYVTTYFRRAFTVADATQFTKLTLNLLRDDGAVVYLNGTEVYRNNLPAGTILYNTYATTALGTPDEATFLTVTLGTAQLVTGTNVLAVEMHQANATSTDLSFDLSLTGGTGTAALTRGPYLQTGTTNSMVVRWRTDTATDSRVLYGTTQGTLNLAATDAAVTTEHVVKVSGLTADTKYYYSVGTTTGTLAGGDANHYFYTHPAVGTVRPIRIWGVSDVQNGGTVTQAVRDSYAAYAGTTRTDIWLTSGDNTPAGLDAEYQNRIFDMFPAMLRNTVIWPAIGNHDMNQSSTPSATLPYFLTFTMPQAGESGGYPSGSMRYYSYDYGNVHFICLDSMASDRSSTGAMMTWLRNDLAATTQRWIIAYWHHVPYSKGTHNSDSTSEVQMTDMRTIALPILEAGKVDLVLGGHSHVYERSYLIDGHYGLSTTFTSAMKVNGGDGRLTGTGAYTKAGVNGHEGAVYITAAIGSNPGALSGTYPAMYMSLGGNAGSLVIDVNGDQMDVKLLLSSGVVQDNFTIRKGSSFSAPAAPTGLTATASAGAVALAWTDASNNETGFLVERGTDGATFAQIASVGANVTAYTDSGRAAGTTYYYRVRATNAYGNSAYSNTASATTPAAAPAAPTGLTATAVSSSQINLAWTDNSSNESGFKVYRSADNVTFAVAATLGAGVTTYANTGLASNTTYYYKVAAYNAAGEAASAVASARTASALPAAPSALKATALSTTSIRLNWTDNAQGQAGFVIEQGSGKTYTQVGTVAAGVVTFTRSGLSAGTKYTYRVKARNASGDSAYSNTASATTARR